MQQRMQTAAAATSKQLSNLQEKSKIYVSTIGKGNTKDLDVAVLKATTNNFHVVPKDKHVRTLKNAVHPSKPRREAQYVIAELLKRLYSANDWVVALKTLIVIHRLMRETDPTFIEELIKTAEEPVSLASKTSTGSTAAAKQKGGAILRVDDFLDMSAGSEARFEFSEWVRAYGKYLDEQLDVYSTINFYLEQENTDGESRFRRLATQDLLFQLPRLHKLLQRLTDCVPRGNTAKDEIVQLSVVMVVKESFKLYKSISEGVINLADSFFEMERLDASKGLELYKQYIAFTEQLQNYYTQVDQIKDLKNHMRQPLDFQLITPPSEFLQQMEEYVAGAPRKMEDGAVVPGGTQKISPPLRRGQRSMKFVSRAHLPAQSGDPGMVLPPGTGPSGADGATDSPFHKESEAADAAASKEVDLLALDFEQDLTVDASTTSAPAVGSSGTPTPLTDLFGNSFNSAPSFNDSLQQLPTFAQQPQSFGQPAFPQQPQSFGQQAFSQPQMAGGPAAAAGNPFGNSPAPSPTSFSSGPSQGPTQGPYMVPGGAPPAPLQVQGLGATGFTDSHRNPSPTTPATMVPTGYAAPSPAPAYSPQSTNGSTASHWGGPISGAPGPAGSPAASIASPAKGLQGTNIKDSALHDPFAEFNTLRKPAPAPAVTHQQSMKALRATGEAPVSPLNNMLGVNSNRSTPLASPHGSFSMASPQLARPTGPPVAAPVGVQLASNGPQAAPFLSGNSFVSGTSSASLTGPQGSFAGPQGSFGPGANTGGAPAGFGGPVFPPQPITNGAAAFPTRFESHAGNGLL